MFYKNLFTYSLFVIFFWFSINSNNGANRDLFLRLKSKLGLYHVVLTTPKNFSRTTYTKCISIATISRQWKDCFYRKIICPNMDNIKSWEKRMCKLHDWCRQLTIVLSRYRISLYPKVMRLIFSWQNTNHSWQNELIYWATLTYFSSCALFWMKKLFKIETNFVRKDCSFYWAFSECTQDLKMSFERNSVRKTLILSACFCWYSRFSLGEMKPRFWIWWNHWLWWLVHGVHVSSLQFLRLHAIPHDEQNVHIVAKV